MSRLMGTLRLMYFVMEEYLHKYKTIVNPAKRAVPANNPTTSLFHLVIDETRSEEYFEVLENKIVLPTSLDIIAQPTSCNSPNVAPLVLSFKTHVYSLIVTLPRGTTPPRLYSGDTCRSPAHSCPSRYCDCFADIRFDVES